MKIEWHSGDGQAGVVAGVWHIRIICGLVWTADGLAGVGTARSIDSKQIRIGKDDRETLLTTRKVSEPLLG